MSIVKKTNALLGLKAEDRVTGFKGVISSICYDLYGCIQVAFTPQAKDGDTELKGSHWFDINRVKVSDERVMDAPDFDAKGKSPETYNHGPSIKPTVARDGKR